MQGDSSNAETVQLELPKALLQEMQRQGPSRRHDFTVSGWQPSFFERVLQRLTGRK